MTNFLLLAVLGTCPVVKMENTTKFPWNAFDMASLHKAQSHCGIIYPGYRCVKLFRKYTRKDYSVVCGKEDSK